VKYVRQAANDPAFLLKAIGEASGELRRILEGIRRARLLEPGAMPDEDWTLLGLAAHMRDVELGMNENFNWILSGRRMPRVGVVDLDDIPLREDYEDEDEDELLDEFHYYRRQTTYLLWSTDERDWARTGLHPYRGEVTLLDLVRDLYQHDLEHLWQAKRMAEALPAQ